MILWHKELKGERIINEFIIGVIGGKSGEAIVNKLHKHGFKVALVVGKNEEFGTTNHIFKDWRYSNEKGIYGFLRRGAFQHYEMYLSGTYCIFEY